ncbi:MAG: hypothetical protein ACHQ0Y_10535 [Thermodesulfovibrionales bacterium]
MNINWHSRKTAARTERMWEKGISVVRAMVLQQVIQVLFIRVP